jgi:hypothetical protein
MNHDQSMTIENLPNELLLEIMGYLDANSLKMVSMVSPHLRALSYQGKRSLHTFLMDVNARRYPLEKYMLFRGDNITGRIS